MKKEGGGTTKSFYNLLNAVPNQNLSLKKEPVESVRPICQLRQDSTEDDRAGTDALLTRRYAARLPP